MMHHFILNQDQDRTTGTNRKTYYKMKECILILIWSYKNNGSVLRLLDTYAGKTHEY